MPIDNTSPKTWIEAEVRHPGALSEAVSYFFFEHGASALIQEDGDVDDGFTISKAGFEFSDVPADLQKETSAFLIELAGIFDLDEAPKAVWNKVDQADWSEKWKENLDPIEIGERLVIKPTWRSVEARPGQVVIELDPGMAFGTGHHPTTLMCLEEIELFFGADRPGPLKTLDLGTGSGILAMAAALLSNQNVIAIDVDPETMPVAAENLSLNGLENRVALSVGETGSIDEKFDLIVANIRLNVLILLSDELARLTAPGATVVLSGLLHDQADAVEREYRSAGFQTIKRRSMDEWTALVLENAAIKNRRVKVRL